jgi:putative transposase
MAPSAERRSLVELSHPDLSVSRQCTLLGVPRSSVYYTPNTSESEANLALMRLIDACYTKHPYYGVPRITDWLKERGHPANHKRVARLMKLMGIQAVVPGPHTSVPHPEHVIYPYLLRDVTVGAPDEVWCADITYIPMERGFMYLVAVMDWFSRYVIAWEVSNTMEADFCVDALKRALRRGTPAIFNTDQGSQFTSLEFTGALAARDVRISMDGRGRALDNVFIERLWRTLKYEDVYLKAYSDGHALHKGLGQYFAFYNYERRHTSLGRRTPAACYHDG